MSAALQCEETARERLLDNILDQLEPIYALIYEDPGQARQAAMDAMDPYFQDERTDLAAAGQIVACGLTAMRVFQQCMRPDIDDAALARLTRIADTIGRTEQRLRKTALYVAPAQPRRPSPPAPQPQPPTNQPPTKHPATKQPTAKQPTPTAPPGNAPARASAAAPAASPPPPNASAPPAPAHQAVAAKPISLESLKEQILASSSLTPPGT
jgi:hypothetical protein